MEFMHEGGMAMWMTLVLFLGSAGAAIALRKTSGARIAIAGAVAVLASGLAGFSTGLYATVAYLDRVAAPERAEILGVGLRESVNNTLFAAVLAFVLGILALALAPRPAPARA